MALPRLAAVLALSLAACGGGSKSSTPVTPGPPSGWTPVDGMACADGTGTGIGVEYGRSDAVLFYLSPGGACWGSAACDTDFLSGRGILRSFGSLEYGFLRAYTAGTVFDRTLPGNPFADWTHVFVPYCTGDVHAGQSVAVHGGVTWQHRGFANLEAAVAEVTSTLPRPAELVVAGSSAGGFGALVAYDLLRTLWDPAGGTTAALLDDSGPTFVGTAMPPALLARWWDVWGLGSTIGASCPACETDLSAVWPTLHARYPRDRLALLSTTRDATMIGFFADPDLGIAAQSGAEFEAKLDGVAARLADLGPEVATYRVGGANASNHPLLAGFPPPFLTTPQGPALLAWVSDLVSLDPAWASSTSP